MAEVADTVVINSFGLVNGSKSLLSAQVEAIAEACAFQLRQHVVPGWNLTDLANIEINVFPSLDDVDPGKGIFVQRLVDEVDVAGAYGYHTPFYAEIEVPVILQAGAGILSNGSSAIGDTVSSVSSHEFIETVVDPATNLWVPFPGTGTWTDAFEAADPVQGTFYNVTNKDGTVVQVSDFVLPAWFWDGAPEGTKLDFMGACSKPFQVVPGGYVVQQGPDGSTQDIWGSVPLPAWRMKVGRRRWVRHAKVAIGNVGTQVQPMLNGPPRVLPSAVVEAKEAPEASEISRRKSKK